MRIAILTSIVISQLGFTCAYIIFVASNLNALVLTLSKCQTVVSTLRLILSELLIFLPMALVRNIAKLSSAALVADVFILIGLVYIFGNEISILAANGIADVKQFNPHDWTLLVGFVSTFSVQNLPIIHRLRRTAVFSFEGIGLVSSFVFSREFTKMLFKVIPIADSMKEPHKFGRALSGVMMFLTGRVDNKFVLGV